MGDLFFQSILPSMKDFALSIIKDPWGTERGIKAQSMGIKKLSEEVVIPSY